MAVSRPPGAREIERLERKGQNIIGVFAGAAASSEEAAAAAERLRAEYGDLIYTALLYCLTFKTFETEEAKRLWQEILQHKYLMSERLRRDVGMRVATLDYFLHYKRIILDARMIALRDLDEILVVANRDSLTGLYNHRTFYERLEEETARARNGGRRLSLLMIDIDHFKSYNDTLGHLKGDLVLREAAMLIRSNIRPGDVACRYGGDEFAVLCPGADKRAALEVGERLRAAAEKKKFFQEEKLDRPLTVSIGVAVFPDDAGDHRALVEFADKALYASKNDGRNRVT